MIFVVIWPEVELSAGLVPIDEGAEENGPFSLVRRSRDEANLE